MKLNNGSVKFLNGSDIEIFDEKEYASNSIILTFAKK